MADPNLVTIFLAVVSVAVLVQAGMMVGFYFLTAKISKKADLAVRQAETLMGPMNQIADRVQTISEQVAAFGAETKDRLGHMHLESEKDAWRAKLNRWTSRSN